MAIRVAFADDNVLVREGLRHVLEDLPEIEVVASSVDLDSLMQAITELTPDVVLTDIRMPPTQGMEGVNVANELRRTHPLMAVIVLNQDADPDYALALLELGSARRGYLLKDGLGKRDQLVAAIKQVAEGGSVLDPRVAATLVEQHRRDARSQLNRLTPRERDVLAELASGKSDAAIARTLVITRRAVERHISAIFAKLDLPAEAEVSRRVAATLVYLSDQSS